MDSQNHFLVAFNLMLVLFHGSASLLEMAIAALVFGAGIDIEMLIVRIAKKRKFYRRSWVQEPCSILLLWLPISIVLFFVKPVYFWLALIPSISHIVIDYITIHKVYMLAPFSYKEYRVGFIKPRHRDPDVDYTGWLHEHYILIINMLIAAILMVYMYSPRGI